MVLVAVPVVLLEALFAASLPVPVAELAPAGAVVPLVPLVPVRGVVLPPAGGLIVMLVVLEGLLEPAELPVPFAPPGMTRVVSV